MDLPAEIWMLIVPNLSQAEISKLSLVNRYLHQLLIPILYNTPDLSHQLQFYKYLQQLPKYGHHVHELDFSNLSNRWTFFNGSILTQITSHCRHIKHLDLNYCRLTDSDLDALLNLDLVTLNLSNCKKLSDLGIQKLVAIQSLEELDLSLLPRVSDISLIPIFKSLKHLQALNLGGSRVSTVALEHLPSSVVYLDLSCCYLIGEEYKKSGVVVEWDTLDPSQVEWESDPTD